MTTDNGFYSIIEHTVDSPETQAELVERFAAIQEQWVNSHPGYRSARFHVSTDGTRVSNVVHWDSEEDYRRFVDTSDAEGRMAAIGEAMAALAGRAELRMPGQSTFRVVREIGPRAAG